MTNAAPASLLHPDDTAKSRAACSGLERLRTARGRPVALAVVRRAQKGASLRHFARKAHIGYLGIVAQLALAAAGVNAGTAGVADLPVRLIPVGGPLPDITSHVIQA